MNDEERKAWATGRVAKLVGEAMALVEEAASLAKEEGIQFNFKLDSTPVEPPDPDEWSCSF